MFPKMLLERAGLKSIKFSAFDADSQTGTVHLLTVFVCVAFYWLVCLYYFSYPPPFVLQLNPSDSSCLLVFLNERLDQLKSSLTRNQIDEKSNDSFLSGESEKQSEKDSEKDSEKQSEKDSEVGSKRKINLAVKSDDDGENSDNSNSGSPKRTKTGNVTFFCSVFFDFIKSALNEMKCG